MEFELDASILGLVRAAVGLGALRIGGSLSQEEAFVVKLSQALPDHQSHDLEQLRELIRRGQDPLGEQYVNLRHRLSRRRTGAFYTNRKIVDSMVAWVLQEQPSRVVDAGCGSGRFSVAVAQAEAGRELVAVDTDPVATILCRASLAVSSARRATVLNADFTQLRLPSIAGKTAFLGNPPYVRHHELRTDQKAWLAQASHRLGHRTSKLAGLHVHFFVATALNAVAGDVGCFVTSAEWLDTNYGAGLRSLLLDGLGLRSLTVFDYESNPFEDIMTTAVITCFELG
ncbi:MAG: methyltransferase, partial [Chloroflexi bacterium]|nr:methyltransferase [Chloroflexota bacterium]